MGIYIKFDGVDGACKKSGHEKWIECGSMNWGAGRASNIMFGDGGAAGTASFSEISVNCVGAGSSLLLLHFLTTGEHFGEVIIDATKSTGGATEEIYSQITLTEAMITGFSQNMDPNQINDNVSIAFKKYKHEVWEQDDKGALKSAGDHGYDVSLNEAV